MWKAACNRLEYAEAPDHLQSAGNVAVGKPIAPAAQLISEADVFCLPALCMSAHYKLASQMQTFNSITYQQSRSSPMPCISSKQPSLQKLLANLLHASVILPITYNYHTKMVYLYKMHYLHSCCQIIFCQDV